MKNTPNQSAQWKMNSPVGSLYLVASTFGLQGIFWEAQPAPQVSSLRGKTPEIKLLSQAVQELEEYFLGKRSEFGLALDVKGTPFQKQVWAQLAKIPYGKTCSYFDIAKKIKNEKAVRAVGTANSKNPLCIIIPCHRVINKNGKPGGYAGGLPNKTKLLNLEQKMG